MTSRPILTFEMFPCKLCMFVAVKVHRECGEGEGMKVLESVLEGPWVWGGGEGGVFEKEDSRAEGEVNVLSGVAFVPAFLPQQFHNPRPPPLHPGATLLYKNN